MKSFRSTVKILLDAFSLSHSDKCRVRETHQAVGLLDHELSFAGYVDQVEGEERSRTAPRANISQIASWAFGRSPSKIDGFDNGRPHGDQGLSQALQAIDALFVLLIISIDQRHEWSSVDEDHLLFRRSLRISENRRPIPGERPGIPPCTNPIKSAIAS